MMYVKQWMQVCLAVMIGWMAFHLEGCAEDDAMADNGYGRCGCTAAKTGVREMALVTESCEQLLAELAGTWDGIGETENTRFEIQADGYYTFWKKKRERWCMQYDGHFWIDFDLSQGMYRTVLHMNIPDNDDYAVRYHVQDDVIYFEEPSDFEPYMRYKKVISEG